MLFIIVPPGREKQVEDGIHGMWHGVACPCHILSSLAAL